MSARTAAATYGRTAGAAGAVELRQVASARPHADLCASLYVCGPYDLHVPAVPVPRLSINLVRTPVSGRLVGDRPLDTIARRHSLFLTPAGAEAAWRKVAPSRHVNVYFDAEALADVVPSTVWDVPRCNVHVPGASGLVDLLERELRQDREFAPEAVDSLARLLLVGLARRGDGAGTHVRTLTPAALRRVREFVDSRLRHRIGVADLARVAGLPPSTFARAFVRQFGEAPYRYVIGRRVQAAVALLSANRQTNDAIAAACGFASAQHLATVLRRQLGATPTEVRHAARSSALRRAERFAPPGDES